jgi:hypothetical protein
MCAGCDSVFSIDEVAAPPAEACGVADPVPATIHVFGTLEDSDTTTPLAGVTVDAMPGGVATTNGMGQFAVDVPTGGNPLHVELVATGALFFPSHSIYYQRALDTAQFDASNKLLSTMALDRLYGKPRDAAAGTVLLSLRDCAGNGVAGQTVAFDTMVEITYQGGGTSTDGTGVAYALNVPQGRSTIHAGAADPFMIDSPAGGVALVFLVQR